MVWILCYLKSETQEDKVTCQFTQLQNILPSTSVHPITARKVCASTLLRVERREEVALSVRADLIGPSTWSHRRLGKEQVWTRLCHKLHHLKQSLEEAAVEFGRLWTAMHQPKHKKVNKGSTRAQTFISLKTSNFSSINPMSTNSRIQDICSEASEGLWEKQVEHCGAL